MLKALIVGADGVCPDYIFEHPERYPNLTKLCKTGASASYSAYVQKGYQSSYLSEMNWASIYTGLPPWEHHITVKAGVGCRMPSMGQFNGLAPFWEQMNLNGLRVGLWAADCCADPTAINGYVIASRYTMLETPAPIRTAPRTLQTCEKDRPLLELLPGEPPPRLYPRTLEQQGYTFAQLRQDPELAWRAIEAYHFQDALDNFWAELEYFYQAICTVQRQNPVDVLYFYTPTTDLIGHCTMYCDGCGTLTKAYQSSALQPENVIVLSDHGMSNFQELVRTSDERVRREAFAARDEVIWLPNGYIAFEARNGALLFTAHGLKGTFIAAGKDIRHTVLHEMRTLDVYPTLLELLGAAVPAGRAGYVLDIFNRPLRNQSSLLREADTVYTTAAVLQCVTPSMTDIVLNELYVRHRFQRFIVVGEEKYREIFTHNPRASGFVPYDTFDCRAFDAVYSGIVTEGAGPSGHILVHQGG